MIAALVFTGCSSDSGPVDGMPDNLCYDFVTLVSTGDHGTVFEFRKNGDSQLITLTAAVKIDTERVAVGSRLIICYVPAAGQMPYQSGAIALYGIAPVVNGEPVPATLDGIMDLKHDPLTVKTLSRSGNYIDMWGEGYGVGEDVTIVLYVDKSTVDTEYPSTYLVYDTGGSEGSLRQVYASFDISDLLSRPLCKGVKVTYFGRTGDETVCFGKDSALPVLPDGNEE